MQLHLQKAKIHEVFNPVRCVRLSSSVELTKYWPYIHELNPQHVKRATKERGFQLDRPLYLGGPVTKLPLKPFKGAKLVLTSVMPSRWKRVPFVINEVTNHFIKLLSHTQPRRVNSPQSPPSSPPLSLSLLWISLYWCRTITAINGYSPRCPTKSREITLRINVAHVFIVCIYGRRRKPVLVPSVLFALWSYTC